MKVGIPVALTLITGSGETKTVMGMPHDGLQKVAAGLEEQTKNDQQGWNTLIVKDSNGQVLRILSPNQGMVMNPSLFQGYFEPYIDQVWSKYQSSEMILDTQASFGDCNGKVEGNDFVIGDQRFAKPCTHDIFNASSGCFATGADAKRNSIIPRLNAEFNRSTLLSGDTFPTPPDQHYKEQITNHYGRLVHAANIDGRGYAHPYDDVAPAGGPDQSGFVNDGAPKLLTVTIGGM